MHHGHQEQFQDFFMHGAKPHECLYCREIPKFAYPSKSICWPSEIPIKGIDGQEYTTCPNCGSDMLEVQGEQLDQWGWKIVCMECEWEIKQAELLDVEQYCGLMEQTKADLTGAIEIMESTSIGTETRIKTVAVQTRKILEDIAYAALVSNKDASTKPLEELKDLRSPREIFRDIEKIHPNFFPTPVEIRAPSKVKAFAVKTKEVLTREKLLQIYRELNPLAHSRNPLDEPIDLKYYEKKLPVWLEEIVNTLATHQVTLLHHPDHFYIVNMKGDRTGRSNAPRSPKTRQACPHAPGRTVFPVPAGNTASSGEALAGMHHAGKGIGPDAGEDVGGDGRPGNDVRTCPRTDRQGGERGPFRLMSAT